MNDTDIHTIISRIQAQKLGLKRYFINEPCRNGHYAERYCGNSCCVECHRIGNGKYRRSHTEKITKSKRAKDKREQKARRIVFDAIVNGHLKKLPCERCGTTKNIHAHHEDYMQPLAVMWLCGIHHKERHREIDIEKERP